MSNIQPITRVESQPSPAAAFGLYPAGVNLAEVATILETVGIRSQDVCVLLPDDHPASESVRRLSSGADTSAYGDAVLAWLGKFGAVVIRGLGSFVSARQFVAALLSGKEGADKSAAILLALGVPSRDAQRYAASIATGGVFIFLYCVSEDARHAADVLSGSGAEEASYVFLDQTPEPELRKVG